MCVQQKEKYVIRGKNGMRFESCSVGHLDEEETYDSIIEAEIALNQIQASIPFEEFIIVAKG